MCYILHTSLAGMIALAISWTTLAIAGPNKDLISAAHRGDVPTVQALLKNGADVNTKDFIGNTALMIASQGGNPDVVKLLLAKGANVNAMTDETPILLYQRPQEVTLRGRRKLRSRSV